MGSEDTGQTWRWTCMGRQGKARFPIPVEREVARAAIARANGMILEDVRVSVLQGRGWATGAQRLSGVINPVD